MKKTYILTAITCAIVIGGNPAITFAAETSPPPSSPPLSPILITEIQPGSSLSAQEEFIELYNTTNQSIDLATHAWQVELASSAAANWDSPYRVMVLTGILAPGQSYILASQYKSDLQTVRSLEGQATMWFTAGLAASAGHLRLTYESHQLHDGVCTAQRVVGDEVEWSGGTAGQPVTPSLDSRSEFITPTSSGIAKSTSLQRVIAPLLAAYQDSNNDVLDFITSAPTPGAVNNQTTSTLALSASPNLSYGECKPTLPAEPSDPAQTAPPPAETGSDGSESAPIDPANEEPSPDEIASELVMPQISEILPNPAAPQTDAIDEFVELYNPNDVPFSLNGFMLEAGEATKHQYVFPTGVSLLAHTYTAFYSRDTGLSLANGGGVVRLLDTTSTQVAATHPYEAAPSGSAWVYIDNVWQWTVLPTPNAPNILSRPVTAAKVPKAGVSTVTKMATVKAASTAKVAKTVRPSPAKLPKTTRPTTPKTTELAAAAAPVRNPLPMGLLAAVGVFALLYGAYEYRHDVANRFHRFQKYRATRRKSR